MRNLSLQKLKNGMTEHKIYNSDDLVHLMVHLTLGDVFGKFEEFTPADRVRTFGIFLEGLDRNESNFPLDTRASAVSAGIEHQSLRNWMERLEKLDFHNLNVYPGKQFKNNPKAKDVCTRWEIDRFGIHPEIEVCNICSHVCTDTLQSLLWDVDNADAIHHRISPGAQAWAGSPVSFLIWIYLLSNKDSSYVQISKAIGIPVKQIRKRLKEGEYDPELIIVKEDTTGKRIKRTYSAVNPDEQTVIELDVKNNSVAKKVKRYEKERAHISVKQYMKEYADKVKKEGVSKKKVEMPPSIEGGTSASYILKTTLERPVHKNRFLKGIDSPEQEDEDYRNWISTHGNPAIDDLSENNPDIASELLDYERERNPKSKAKMFEISEEQKIRIEKLSGKSAGGSEEIDGDPF